VDPKEISDGEVISEKKAKSHSALIEIQPSRTSLHHAQFKQQQINNVHSTYKGVQDERE